jgi:toxin FitB
MFVLDTNVISELGATKKRASPFVRDWAAAVDEKDRYLSAVTILELEVGALRRERRDPAQASELRAWVRLVREAFEGRILPFGEQTAALCAALHVPVQRPERDAMIAATAKEHGFTVVTRNTRDFEGCGVRLINPWVAGAGG